MPTCSQCATENPEGARFCLSCGVPFRVAPEVRELRKTVTVLFCDVVGSTALGESQDPEAVRAVLARYFERMRGIVEAHEGTVQKFIGDAVVAVFGVPVVHEDDAVRAVRAAAEMRKALPELGVEARIGVNTGEVVTSSDDTLVTGDAVNVAARLQQAAAPGEVLIGEPTRALAWDAISIEELVPLELKGKQAPVPAFRLLDVREPAERAHEGRFVGRVAELGLLGDFWAHVLESRCCELVTIVGEPGVGKSRLVTELTAGLEGRVVRGRCVSYGEGITYWAVAQVVRELAGIREEQSAGQARARLDAVLAGAPDGSAVAAQLAQLLGLGEGSTTPAELAWAVRQLLTAAAQELPLVVLVDDIHWAEPVLLQLLAGLPAGLEDAPVLVLCLARPELLETTREWPVTMQLGPLRVAEVDALLDYLEAPPGVRGRLAQAAAGNPLYAEELVAWAREGGDLDGLPTSLNALLGARLDRLGSRVRDVLERGAIEGELFHRSAVIELSVPVARASVPAQLETLADKDILRPAEGSFGREAAFRFKHLLIRDAAYAATAKKLRAALHEQFAVWLERVVGERMTEYEEILAYHLEQSYRYHAELGPLDEESRGLGRRAATLLASAGHRALVRGDVAAAAKLLERALALGVDNPGERTRVQVDLAYALGETGRMSESDAMLEASIDAATGLEERGLALRALVQRSLQRLVGDLSLDPAEVVPVAEAAAETFAKLGDSSGLALAERLLAIALALVGRSNESRAALERAFIHAEASGDPTTRRRVVGTLSFFLAGGPHGSWPVREAIQRCEELLELNREDPVLKAAITRSLSLCYAMAGRFDEARDLVRQSSLVLDELNQRTVSSVFQRTAAEAKELIGDRAGAEQERVARYLHLRDAAGGAPDGTAIAAALELANFYCDDGRWEKAADCLAYAKAGEPILHRNRRERRADLLSVEARLAAHRGRLAEALTLAQQAVALVEPFENLDLQARMQVALSKVHRSTGRTAEADAAAATAIQLYEERGNTAAAARLRSARNEVAQ